MKKVNCWEYKKCGREPGGAKEAELGICQAAKLSKVNGVNSGTNGGRVCWVIAGTLCGGKVQGSFAIKLANCLECEFYKSVIKEEGNNLAKNKDVIEKLY